MIPCRSKFLPCVLLGFFSVVCAAQQVHRPALGNAVAAKQRSAKFLAERGLGIPRSSRSPAQMLGEARAQRQTALVSSALTGPVPAWQPLGPAQVFTSAYGAVAGRVTSIAADPSDSTGNTVYVGTAFGGVWESTNGAAANAASVTFAPLTDNLFSSLSQPVAVPSLSIGAVSVQPVTAGTAPVLLAGTGDPNDTTASYFGSGILRSADGGNQWTVISQTGDQKFSFMGNGFAGFAWGSVAGSPVVVAAVSQAQESVEVNAGATQQSILGIYYSTDLGQTWYMASINDPGGPVQTAGTSFTPCLAQGSRLPCGNAAVSIVWNPVWNLFLAAVRYHGYYASPDGQTWTRIAAQPGANLTVAMCPYLTGNSGSPACPIYNGALATQPVTGDSFALTTDINNQDQGLWQLSCPMGSGANVCDLANITVTQIGDAALDCGSTSAPNCPAGNSQPTVIPQADYDLYLAAVPAVINSQPDTLLFAGTADIYRCDLNAGCAWRNTTHAQSFDCNSAHVAPAQYAIDATFGASGLLYFGNDGGVWRSTDAVDQTQPQCSSDDSAHFQNLNPGFTGSIAAVEDLAVDPTNSQNMMVSLGPLGTAAQIPGFSTWQQALDGEGDYAAIDPVLPQNWYASSEFAIGVNLCSTGPDCGPGYFNDMVLSSSDYTLGGVSDADAQTIPAPWILDPQNPDNLILGTCRVWRGPAGGGTQIPLSTSLDDNNQTYCAGNGEIRSLAGSGKTTDAPGAAEMIYAGMAGLFDGGTAESGGATVAGHVFAQSVTAASSGQTTWTDLSHNTFNFNPNGYDISSIAVDPHSSGGQTVYVTVQGFGGTLLYQSTNAGSSWQNISSNIPNAPANSVLVDPNDANTVYVATDAGVYYTHTVNSCVQPGSSCWSPFGTSLPNVPVVLLTAINSGATPTLLASTYGRGVWQIDLPSLSATTATSTPTSLTFGNEQVGTTSAPLQLLITNTGTLPLQPGSISVSGNFNESDTCVNSTINPGDACTIEVRFAPAQAGSSTGLLTLYANLAGGQLTVPLSGTGTPGAAVTLTPSALCFAPALIGQPSSTSCQGGVPAQPGQPPIQPGQSIVIANTGGATISLSSISISGDFAIVANTCGNSLAPANTANDSCTLNITFTPTASGNRSGTLTVIDSAGTQTAQLLGTGQTAATDVLTPASLTFASQAVGSVSAAQQVTLTNNGDQPLQSISVLASTAFNAVNSCGTTLGGHSSCAIMVSFLPVTIGAQSGVLTVSDTIAEGSSAKVDSQQVVLSGTGTAPSGIVSATPLSLDFGYYAVSQTSPVQTVTVTNNGGSNLSGIQTAVSGDFSTRAASQDPCGATLAIGASCNIGLVFSPSQISQRTGSLTITASGLSVPLVVALSGSGASFTMKVTGSSSQVITGAQTAQPFQLEIDPVGGSTGPVALTCAVVPATATCTVSPTSVMLTGGSSQNATVTFSVAQQAAANTFHWKSAAFVLALLLPIGFLGAGRRRWSALSACVFLLLLFPTGCGVNSSGGGTGTGASQSSSAGQYNITVSASIPGLTQTASMQVSVQ